MGQKLNEKEWKVPEHIAIILDGNGRWAKKRGMPRNFGHLQGMWSRSVVMPMILA